MVALVGHRGVGKTSLLKRIKNFYQEIGERVDVFDLDNEIEKFTGQSISEIFSQHGESYFRQLEGHVLKKISEEFSESLAYVALGAGYETEVPEGVQIIWVQRPSDIEGRVFLNRPRLNSEQTPLGEYFSRWQDRQARYRKMASETLILNEGDKAFTEKKFFLNTIKLPQGSAITLFSHQIFSLNFKTFIQKRINWGYQYFELRDDLLTKEQVMMVLDVIPKDKVLLSLRKKDSFMHTLLKDGYSWDWALELGPPPESGPTIVSLHELQPGESFSDALFRLSSSAPTASIQKCALSVNNWEELQLGHKWSQTNNIRSFLPRSKSGRWQWYRWLSMSNSPINFIKEDLDSSAADQPTLLEASTRDQFENQCLFAAILGWPVDHSWTPSEQQEFFLKKTAAVLRVPIKKSEFDKALDVLTQLGLRWAAVTAPLKQVASIKCSLLSSRAERLKSVNTLKWSEPFGWQGHNTDLDGLKKLFADIPDSSSVAVWGGGGTLSLIKELLPMAKLYSARTGKLRDDNQTQQQEPDVVIWACGRFEEMAWPPVSWNPKMVIDLSYAANSAGKEYALLTKANYQSGEVMFFTQAQEQRRFWNEGCE